MLNYLHYLSVGLLFANLASFFWSVFGVFIKYPDFDKIKYRLLQVNSLAVYSICLKAVFFFSPSYWAVVIYSLILCICLISFWINSNLVKKHQFSIIFSNDAPQAVLKSGLYRFVRHPFYLIYLIVYFSTAIMTGDLWVYLFSGSIFYLYYKAARKEENKFLSSALRIEYEGYIQSTGMFIPHILKK